MELNHNILITNQEFLSFQITSCEAFRPKFISDFLRWKTD